MWDGQTGRGEERVPRLDFETKPLDPTSIVKLGTVERERTEVRDKRGILADLQE